MSVYQLLECIEHKLLFHKNEYTVFLTNQTRLNGLADYTQLMDFGFCNECYALDFQIKNETKDEILQSIEAKFVATVGKGIEEFTEFYIAGVHTPLSALLIQKRILFNLFEDGQGALSHPWILYDINKNGMSKERFEFLNQYGLFAPDKLDNNVVKAKYCDYKSQISGFNDTLAIDFNVLDKFEMLTRQQQKNIKILFCCPQITCQSNRAVLLLTQQFANLQQMSFESQICIYQLLSDYLFDDYTIYIKPHPDDLMFYEYIIRDAFIIREKFPAELLPFVFDKAPDTLATVTSTGVKSIKNFFLKTIEFTDEFESNFEALHKYNLVSKILCHFSEYNVLQLGCLEMVIENIMHESRNINKTHIISNQIKIFDDFAGRELITDEFKIAGDNDILIFINSKKYYKFYNYYKKQYFYELFPIVMNIKRTSDVYNYFSDKEEVIFVYSKDKKAIKEIKTLMEGNKVKLKNSGLEIDIKELSEDQIRIKVLEGLLEATEKRLLEYIGEDNK